MINLILNDQDIAVDIAPGITVLDFVRYRQNLKGTKIGCREGDCGACTIMVGELVGSEVRYRTMTSCLMPLANAAGKHIVTIEGINPSDGSLTPVQQAMVDESGTQCGFCTVGFVMSLTNFAVDSTAKTPEMAVSAIDGNICRCTGYRSIERAACHVSGRLSEETTSTGDQNACARAPFVPPYFSGIASRLSVLQNISVPSIRTLTQAVLTGGGTDLYVQRPEAMAESASTPLLYTDELRNIRKIGNNIEIGASVTVTDLLESPLMNEIFPDLYKHLKLVSSTPIRNMATLAGNLINGSPIGDMTVFFLGLDSEVDLWPSLQDISDDPRTLPLRDLYLGYKQLAKHPDEIITAVRFKIPTGDFRFNFEKVCKRTYLDIATVNTAISLEVRALPGDSWLPPVLTEPGTKPGQSVAYTIVNAHVAAGGVAPIPMYLRQTSEFLRGKPVTLETIAAANEIIQSEISPISDVRGTEQYKRLLLRQLFRAHFVELFGI
ncbi:MAG TPA: FAD binding domain-containing protein [Pyrinomonadaceae bacterium]|nr:FAD binding domain-containing protein [Chloracidobacterium sp.]MBP9934902.1 FAD binding domain-containing protein [Pyrinomonadaceae bacterium]MBK7803330.1 FAD binding domain-containing protein [Chloracidobacterium sp.]MBK9766628.1 FAD binding domain-containing protein [Chloracidobacterium sp.]MBL0241103.1 FAD binding domain-containing protein [Chloracidobacterium sp.]